MKSSYCLGLVALGVLTVAVQSCSSKGVTPGSGSDEDGGDRAEAGRSGADTSSGTAGTGAITGGAGSGGRAPNAGTGGGDVGGSAAGGSGGDPDTGGHGGEPIAGSDTGGTSGSGGMSGTAGSGGSGGTAGSAGTGGTAGVGGNAGRGGTSGAGTGGSAGKGGSGGTGGTTNACTAAPCKNGGSCALNGQSFRCTCTASWFGATCTSARFQWIGVPTNFIGTFISGTNDNGTVFSVEFGSFRSSTGGRWSATGGFQELALPPSQNATGSRGVSGNGLVFVGSSSPSTLGPYVATRWVNNQGEVLANFASWFNASNRDGSVLVGGSSGGIVRWTAATGAELLPSLHDQIRNGEAWAVTPDGTTLVGYSVILAQAGGQLPQPVRWTRAGGLEDLGGLTFNPEEFGEATAISNDGTIIAGHTSDKVFRWQNGTMADLGALGANTFTRAMNAAGTIIVGCSAQVPFIWVQGDRLRPLNEYLTTRGITAPTLNGCAQAISDDGTVIAGNSTNGTHNEGWVLRL